MARVVAKVLWDTLGTSSRSWAECAKRVMTEKSRDSIRNGLVVTVVGTTIVGGLTLLWQHLPYMWRWLLNGLKVLQLHLTGRVSLPVWTPSIATGKIGSSECIGAGVT